MTFKVVKVATNDFTCNIELEHRHNYAINSLEALSFNILLDEVRKEVNPLFLNNLTPSQKYNEFFLNLKKDCVDDLNFHLQTAGRSKCPKRRDFNSLCIKHCQEHFGGKNGPEIFCYLEE